jgi:hypothetical protein
MIFSSIFSNNFRKLPNLLKFCPNYLINVFPKEKDLNQNTFSKRENFGTNNKSVTLFYFDEEPIINCIIDYLRSEGNNQNCMELFNNTFEKNCNCLVCTSNDIKIAHGFGFEMKKKLKIFNGM